MHAKNASVSNVLQTEKRYAFADGSTLRVTDHGAFLQRARPLPPVSTHVDRDYFGVPIDDGSRSSGRRRDFCVGDTVVHTAAFLRSLAQVDKQHYTSRAQALRPLSARDVWTIVACDCPMCTRKTHVALDESLEPIGYEGWKHISVAAIELRAFEVVYMNEKQEIVALLAEHTPTDADEVTAVVAELHEAMDAQDAIDAEEKAATFELKAKLEEARAPFRARSAEAGALLAAAKAALVRGIEADEARRLAAVNAKKQVPSPLSLPKGLSVKRQLQITQVDVTKLGDDYLSVVPDTDALLSAHEAGTVIDGAEFATVTTVVYRRPVTKKNG